MLLNAQERITCLRWGGITEQASWNRICNFDTEFESNERREEKIKKKTPGEKSRILNRKSLCEALFKGKI